MLHAQGAVPAGRSGEDFELGVMGWNVTSRFLLRPQVPIKLPGAPEVWNMLQLQVGLYGRACTMYLHVLASNLQGGACMHVVVVVMAWDDNDHFYIYDDHGAAFEERGLNI